MNIANVNSPTLCLIEKSFKTSSSFFLISMEIFPAHALHKIISFSTSDSCRFLGKVEFLFSSRFTFTSSAHTKKEEYVYRAD